jgi:predicted acetyltransferase
MADLEFERPHPHLQDSYRGLVREFQDRGEGLIPFPLSFPHDDFPAYVAKLRACERGEGLPDGFVPHSTYWLVCGGEVVGLSNLRHALTEALRIEGGNIGYGVRPSARRRGHATQLLRRTCMRAREIGLTEVLLTCSKANIPSVRTIVACGGVLHSEAYLPSRGEIIQRYFIDTGTP